MSGLGTIKACELSAGDNFALAAGPVALTSFIVCERTGLGPAAVELNGTGGQGPYFQLRVPKDGAITFNDAVALPAGLLVVCHEGEVSVSVVLR